MVQDYGPRYVRPQHSVSQEESEAISIQHFLARGSWELLPPHSPHLVRTKRFTCSATAATNIIIGFLAKADKYSTSPPNANTQ